MEHSVVTAMMEEVEFCRERAQWWRGFALTSASPTVRESRIELADFFERRAHEVLARIAEFSGLSGKAAGAAAD